MKHVDLTCHFKECKYSLEGHCIHDCPRIILYSDDNKRSFICNSLYLKKWEEL